MGTTNRVTTPQKSGHLIYVAEVELDSSRPAEWVRITFSIAGRDSSFVMAWPLSHGCLDSGGASDLAAVVAKTVTESIVTMCSVQEVLPLS